MAITTGRIELDEILAQLGPTPYSTTQTEYLAPAMGDAKEFAKLTGFAGSAIDVRLTVPNDLVVRSSSLQTPGAPIGLGALSVTLGGDLRAVKDPGGEVRLVGTVNTVRGTYDFQGRRFDILRDGTVRFEGPVTSPVFDIRTSRVIQGVEAIVTLRGTLDQPEIVLA